MNIEITITKKQLECLINSQNTDVIIISQSHVSPELICQFPDKSRITISEEGEILSE